MRLSLPLPPHCRDDITKLVKQPQLVVQCLFECGMIPDASIRLNCAIDAYLSQADSKIESFALVLCITGNFSAFNLLSDQLRQRHLRLSLPSRIESFFDPSRLNLTLHSPSLPAKLGVRKFCHIRAHCKSDLSAIIGRLAPVLKLELCILPVCTYLELYGVLEPAQVIRIKGGSDESACDELLELLIASNCSIAIERFAHALILSRQWLCFMMLKGEKMLRMDVLEEIGRTHLDFLLEFENRENHSLSGASIMPICFDESIEVLEDVENEDDCIEPAGLLDIAVDEVDSDVLCEFEARKNEIYANFSQPKGYVLIINNKHFAADFNDRHGTDVDECNVRSLLEKLGYRVDSPRKNLSADDMLRAARAFATHPDQQFADSAVVVVMTHGKYDRLVGSDGNDINVHDFLACFNARNAPLLKGKPKVFFIQACRGEYHDDGLPMQGLDSTDMKSLASLFSCMRPTPTRGTQNFNANATIFAASPEQEPKPNDLPPFPEAVSLRFGNNIRNRGYRGARNNAPKTPTEADMLVAFATTPRYVSWRNSTRGSWFIQSVCEVFSKFAATEDICKLLTRVNRRVAEAYESDRGRQKQIPEFVNRLQKQFYFFPGVVKRKIVNENSGTAV